MFRGIIKLMLTSSIFINIPLALAENSQDFIQRQTLIRVCMGKAPNFGDQASTYNVMSHLRALGFRGEFEVIYDAPSTLAKVTLLFGLPDKIPAIYRDKTKHITFIELKANEERNKAHQLPLMPLGFSVGKTDRICEANDVNTQYFMQFSPYFDARGGWHNQTEIQLQSNSKTIYQNDSGNKFFRFPVPTFNDLKIYLSQDPAGILLSKQKPGLAAFLTGLENHSFNMLPLYGRTLRFLDNPSGDTLTGSPSPSNILQILVGARLAQLSGSASLQKPLIIVVFDSYQKYAEKIKLLLSQTDWGVYEQAGAELARDQITRVNLAASLQYGALDDADIIQKIQSLQNGQILLLSTGSLPKLVFDSLFSYKDTNVLPGVIEGAGSFSLLIQSDKPYFECADTSSQIADNQESTDWTLGIDSIKNPALKQQFSTFYHLRKGFCGSLPNDHSITNNFMQAWKNNVPEQFGKFIVDAQSQQSDLTLYFHEIENQVKNNKNDRVLYALDEITK